MILQPGCTDKRLHQGRLSFFGHSSRADVLTRDMSGSLFYLLQTVNGNSTGSCCQSCARGMELLPLPWYNFLKDLK